MIDESNKRRLSVRARLLKALGEELITSDVVAIVELIKNSYDADAELVRIRFRHLRDESASFVEVSDDGHGMSHKVVKSAWLEVATDRKRKESLSPGKRRRFLGAKGIGRFAAARIGTELELVTRVKGSDNEVYAYFDWSQLDDESKLLEDVEFLSEERPPEVLSSEWRVFSQDQTASKIRDLETSNRPSGAGTILKMNGLRKQWEKRDFVELQRALSRLISPYAEVEDFTVFLDLPDEYSALSDRIRPPDIVNYPHYRCYGAVEADGRYEFTICLGSEQVYAQKRGWFYRQEDAGDWEISDSPNPPDDEDMRLGIVRQIECGAFQFDFKFWDRDQLGSVDQKLHLGVRALRDDLNYICGINIYRDGFRVLPYGEPNNDWLRLDVRRVQKPTKHFSNNQIFGHVSITADGNPQLKDSSNREGLDATPGSLDLQMILLNILNAVENVRYSLKRDKKHKGKRGGQPNLAAGLFEEPDFHRVKSAVSDEGSSEEDVVHALDELHSQWRDQLTRLKERLSQYRSLASLGAIVDKIVHEGGDPLSRIVTDSTIGYRTQLKLVEDHPEINSPILRANRDRFKEISGDAERVQAVFRHIIPFGGRKRGRPKKLYAEDLIKDIFDFFSNDIKKSGVKVNLPSSQSLVMIDESEFKEIVQNLLLNSLFWLRKVPRSQRFIEVKVGHVPGKEFELIFADSGPGIQEQDRERIFEPYVSTKEGGSGMGLTIIGEIVRDYYAGELELVENEASTGTVFRAVFRKRV